MLSEEDFREIGLVELSYDTWGRDYPDSLRSGIVIKQYYTKGDYIEITDYGNPVFVGNCPDKETLKFILNLVD